MRDVFKCLQCSADMSLHQPQSVSITNEFITQLTLVPTYSIDERVCRKCGALHVPVIMKADLGWSVLAPKKEEKRIIEASSSLLRKVN